MKVHVFKLTRAKLEANMAVVESRVKYWQSPGMGVPVLYKEMGPEGERFSAIIAANSSESSWALRCQALSLKKLRCYVALPEKTTGTVPLTRMHMWNGT